MKVDKNKIETSERISTLSELDAVRENDLFKTMKGVKIVVVE